jgi:flagellar biogenesis protein FliO
MVLPKMNNAHTSTAVTESTNTPLQLRKDEVITTAFVLKTILVLACLLVVAYAILRWVSARNPVTNKTGKKSTRSDIRIISSVKTSLKTKVVLLEIDGCRAVIIETQQGSRLEWLPDTGGNSAREKGEI